MGYWDNRWLSVIVTSFDVDMQRHGKGKLRTCTRNTYEGEFNYDQMHGQGKMVYANKDQYIGKWKYGMVSERWESKYVNAAPMFSFLRPFLFCISYLTTAMYL